MFNKWKIILAKNYVIMELVEQGLIDKDTENIMRDIAGNPMNILYGKGMLKKKIANCKFSAAAAIFSRLVAYSEVKPSKDVTGTQWRIAAVHAMIHAGASKDEAIKIVEDLVKMNKEILDKDTFNALQT